MNSKITIDSSAGRAAGQSAKEVDLTGSAAGEEDPGSSLDLPTLPATTDPGEILGRDDEDCPECEGSGMRADGACPVCQGTGRVPVGVGAV